MRFFGLIGKTLEHSFSPSYFKEKFKKENINDAYYLLYPLKSIDEFIQLINEYSELSGLNVTIPYKKSIIPFLDKIDNAAEEIGAVNTIKFERNLGKLELTGFNTDYLGFIDSIKPHLKKEHNKAIILGTGGSSMAVAYAFKKMGIEFIKISRNPKNNNEKSYSFLNKEILNQYNIIVNTTPLGMYPNISEKPEIPYNVITDNHIFYDLIYNPLKTEFLVMASKNGALTINGLNMLKIQADYSWKIWNNLI